MENIKVRHFVKILNENGKLHPLYREVFDAYIEQNTQAVEDDLQSKNEEDFFNFYKNLLGHLKKRFIQNF